MCGNVYLSLWKILRKKLKNLNISFTIEISPVNIFNHPNQWTKDISLLLQKWNTTHLLFPRKILLIKVYLKICMFVITK